LSRENIEGSVFWESDLNKEDGLKKALISQNGEWVLLEKIHLRSRYFPIILCGAGFVDDEALFKAEKYKAMDTMIKKRLLPPPDDLKKPANNPPHSIAA
jgi:hypothetical protein